MAGTIVADTIRADSTSTLVLRNGVANTPPTIQDNNGTQIGTFCRAWVNFNGTTNVGGFCTIRASFNVTSVADNGTGDYTVNFTTAMPDANYSIATSCGDTAVNPSNVFGSSFPVSSSACRVEFIAGSTNFDMPFASVAIFR
jgi:hypothetical protein